MADILSKPLAKIKFVHFRDNLGIVKNETLAERESQHQSFIEMYYNAFYSDRKKLEMQALVNAFLCKREA